MCRSNHVLRRQLPNGYVSTLVGTAGSPGFVGSETSTEGAQLNHPWFATYSTSASAVLFTDAGNCAVRKVLMSDGAATGITTVSGQPTACGCQDGARGVAQFSQPAGIVEIRPGQVLVADAGCHAIRLVDTNTGFVRTVAGQLGTAGYSDGAASLLNTPIGLHWDPVSSRLFIAGMCTPALTCHCACIN